GFGLLGARGSKLAAQQHGISPLPKCIHRAGEVGASSKLFYSIAVETRILRRGIASRFYLRFCPQESGTLFDWSGLHVRRSLPIGLLLLAALTASLRAQEMTPENPTTGTIQGTLLDDDGNAVEGARVLYSSQATETKGVTRSGKDGTYVSEAVPPGPYVVRVEGRDMAPVESRVNVVLGAAVTADFKLEWINPAPVRLESKFSGEVPDRLPIDGRNYLNAGQLEPGVQAVDGRIFDPGKSGFQSLSINSQLGRTTHYDVDEVEAMDETRGASTLNLPADAVREVIVSRA